MSAASSESSANGMTPPGQESLGSWVEVTESVSFEDFDIDIFGSGSDDELEHNMSPGIDSVPGVKAVQSFKSKVSTLLGEQKLLQDTLAKLRTQRDKIEQGVKDSRASEKLSELLTDLAHKKASAQEKLSATRLELKAALATRRKKLQLNMQLRKDRFRLGYGHRLRQIDKISFIGGVALSWVTCFMLAAAPLSLVYLWGYLMAGFLVVRFFYYRHKNLTYFLFEMCYYANVLFLLYIFVFPNSAELFSVVFGLASGPLLWAIAVWRCTLVFHDWEVLTSLFIHLIPPVICYVIRWNLDPSVSGMHFECVDEKGVLTNTHTMQLGGASGLAAFAECDNSWYNTVIKPWLAYLLWQCGYYLKTEVALFRITKSISAADDPAVMTSFKWLTESLRETWIGRIYYKYVPENLRVFGYIAFQAVYTLITMLFNKFYYRHRMFHTCVLLGVTGISVWNGANFYFEFLSKKYERNMERENTKLQRIQERYERTKQQLRTFDVKGDSESHSTSVGR